MQTEEFGSGVMVLPIEYAKGLEFDAVLLLMPVTGTIRQRMALQGRCMWRLRALHELVVLYTGKLTDLIAVTVSEEKKQNTLWCGRSSQSGACVRRNPKPTGS